MSKFKFGLLGMVIASLLSIGNVQATPANGLSVGDIMTEALTVNPHIVKVRGCHSNKRWHWVKKWGKKAWHRHKYNCKPVATGRHCHKKWRKHWHKGWGTKWHRHRGATCFYQ